MDQSLTADIVVVGAGSSGCVLASRLSEIAGLRVLLLEAGPRDRLGLTRLPSALVRLAGRSGFDWGYTSQPDPSRDGSVEDWPRGRVLGGSSAINGAIFVRGAPADYDAWEAMGNPGWGWRDVLPLFRRMETADAPDNLWRGGLGPQRVSGLRWVHPLTPKFIAAAVAAGIPFSEDLNGAHHEGIGYNQGSTIDGRRHGAYDAFVAPTRRAPNLQVLSDTLVEQVLFEGRRAVGVQARRGGEPLRITARLGVVILAGAINSPHLLMLSGIGPAAALAERGVSPRLNRPEVGRNLIEHPGLHLQVEVDERTGNQEAAPGRALWNLGRWLLHRNGPIAAPTTQALAFFRSTPDAAEPDLQFHLFPYGAKRGRGRRNVSPLRLLTVLVNVNHPRSRGWIELRSADPAVPAAIHPRLLDDPADLECLAHGLDWVRRVVATPPFGPHVLRLLDAPPPTGDGVKDRAADVAFLRAATVPFLHPAGTCRMGQDAGAVVGPDLAVRGVAGLWVADASIFPRHIAGNINATALMIGEKAASLIVDALTGDAVTGRLMPAAVPRPVPVVEPVAETIAAITARIPLVAGGLSSHSG